MATTMGAVLGIFILSLGRTHLPKADLSAPVFNYNIRQSAHRERVRVRVGQSHFNPAPAKGNYNEGLLPRVIPSTPCHPERPHVTPSGARGLKRFFTLIAPFQ